MWPYPTMIAHRGGGTTAPENTLAALAAGLRHGYRAVEFDVMLSRDGIGVVIHDADFGRTVPGSGSVPDTDAFDLVKRDAGGWFGAAFAGEPVPLFVPFAEYCKAHGIWMNVEIKPAPGHDEATGRWVAGTVRTLFARETDSAGLPLLSSFSTAALRAARAAAPELPRAILFGALPPDWEGQARELGVVAVHADHRRLTPALAQAVKSAGFGLFCYTVNDPARARTLLDWGVDALCTDRIDLLPADFI
ncbi:glycerophosphodiester phosphodiesterase [Massilia dura]|uniref:Glycerophosphodiester phosphodiesterase n=1 Tax=Pseudoduganella dura TaxID=321982 RepID=A0A6I3XG80_9BURK|nr:glycerophosphodiester phosphodiesterase [Pseudoduganella dura]MUI12252.1 glycerophosphodiester phosphodiesterase [Pseudoduganella dura]GGY06312.1 glycerophosphoryl diester phosphodiesterase [Pseudoduganella dura]